MVSIDHLLLTPYYLLGQELKYLGLDDDDGFVWEEAVCIHSICPNSICLLLLLLRRLLRLLRRRHLSATLLLLRRHLAWLLKLVKKLELELLQKLELIM